MRCRACGRPDLGIGQKLVTLVFGNIIEPICWVCRYWLEFGKVYDVR